MNKGILGIRHIFGLKVKDLRLNKNLSYLQLADKTGMSVSYLSEIEKGKKYPRGDKIMSLAAALDVKYDYLVSLKVSQRLQPIVDLVNSEFFKEFPLELFGLEAQKVIEIFSVAPEKLNAFISSIQQIARNYEMNYEQFYKAALRSYQELNNNYIQSIEEKVKQFRAAFDIAEIGVKKQRLLEILEEYFAIKTDFSGLDQFEALKHVRSHYNPQKKLLRINQGLSDAQECFLIARELGFQYLDLMDSRPYETPPQNKHSFDALLCNFKASYFAAALLISDKEIKKDFEAFEKLEFWDKQFLLKLLIKYNATPEMLMQRFTNLLPAYLDAKNLFFLRIVGRPDKNYYKITKELHLNKLHSPHSNEINEHYCRRWMALKIMDEVKRKVDKNQPAVLCGAQISSYWQSGIEYLVLTLALPNATKKDYVISISIGFQINPQLRKRIKFLNDPKLLTKIVHTTCERCNILDCEERQIAPHVFNNKERQLKVALALEKL